MAQACANSAGPSPAAQSLSARPNGARLSRALRLVNQRPLPLRRQKLPLRVQPHGQLLFGGK
jgi:hypothetical protein